MVEALGVWEEASTNGLGTVGGQCGCTLHNMHDVLRNVQCRISALTTVANFGEVSASWYSKTNILRMPITQTDALQIDLSTAKAARRPGTEMLRKVAATQLTQTREHGRIYWCGGLPRERTQRPKGACELLPRHSPRLGVSLSCSQLAAVTPSGHLRGRRRLIPLPSLGVARAGAVAPTTTSARGATRVGHPIASSIHPRSDTPAGRGCPRFRFPQFLTSQPLEDGTDCAAVAVIFLWEWVTTHIRVGVLPALPDARDPPSVASVATVAGVAAADWVAAAKTAGMQ